MNETPTRAYRHGRTILSDTPFEDLREAAVWQMIAAAQAGAPLAADGTLKPRSEWTDLQKTARLVVTETFIEGEKVEERQHYSFPSIEETLELLRTSLPDKTVERAQQSEFSDRLRRMQAMMEADEAEKVILDKKLRDAGDLRLKTELREKWAEDQSDGWSE
jgi:hypothetical protein